MEQARPGSEVQPCHKQKLDVAPAETFLSCHPVKNQRQHQNADADHGSADQPVFELKQYSSVHQWQGRRPPDDAEDDKPVRNLLNIQIHKRQAHQCHRESAPADCLRIQRIAENNAEEGQSRQQLHDHIAGRDFFTAVPASSPEKEVAENRDQICRAERVTADRTVASSLQHTLMMHDTPCHAIDEAPENRSENKGDDINIDFQECHLHHLTSSENSGRLSGKNTGFRKGCTS